MNDALKAWIEANGSDLIRAQFREGFLDEEDALDMLREHLFSPLKGERPWRKMSPVYVCKAASLSKTSQHKVEFSTRPAEPEEDALSPAEYQTYARIRELAPAGSAVVLRFHHGQCSCGAACEAPTVHVCISWNGYKLAREFNLRQRKENA
jgi:hypothetical protein